MQPKFSIVSTLRSLWKFAPESLHLIFFRDHTIYINLERETHEAERRMRNALISAKATRIQWQMIQNNGIYEKAARLEIELLDSIVNEVAQARKLLLLITQRTRDLSTMNINTTVSITRGLWHMVSLHCSSEAESRSRLEVLLSVHRIISTNDVRDPDGADNTAAWARD